MDHLPINVHKVGAIGIPDERIGEIAAASVWSKNRTDPDPHQGTVKAFCVHSQKVFLTKK